MCLDNPCKHGVCEEIEGSFRCVCNSPFIGPLCDHKSEDRLAKMLKDRYTTHGAHSNAIYLGIVPKHIYRLDAHEHRLTVLVQVTEQWRDSQLTWTAMDFNNITKVHLSREDIWSPEINVLEGVQTSNQINNKLGVVSSGFVTLKRVTELSVPCTLRLRWFPFDHQSCKLSFTTPSVYETLRQTLKPINLKMPRDMSSVWTLDSVKLQQSNHFTVAVYNLNLDRKGAYYGFSHIFPVVLLVFCAILYLLLRPFGKVKYFMGAALLIAAFVLLVVLGREIPMFGMQTPMLGIYYIVVFLLILASLLICASVNNFIVKSKSTLQPPHAIKKLLLGPCWHVLCLPASVRCEQSYAVMLKDAQFTNELPIEEPLGEEEETVSIGGDSTTPLTPRLFFERMNSSSSANNNCEYINIWHIVAVAMDKLLLLILIVISVVIAVMAMAR